MADTTNNMDYYAESMINFGIQVQQSQNISFLHASEKTFKFIIYKLKSSLEKNLEERYPVLKGLTSGDNSESFTDAIFSEIKTLVAFDNEHPELNLLQDSDYICLLHGLLHFIYDADSGDKEADEFLRKQIDDRFDEVKNAVVEENSAASAMKAAIFWHVNYENIRQLAYKKVLDIYDCPDWLDIDELASLGAKYATDPRFLYGEHELSFLEDTETYINEAAFGIRPYLAKELEEHRKGYCQFELFYNDSEIFTEESAERDFMYCSQYKKKYDTWQLSQNFCTFDLNVTWILMAKYEVDIGYLYGRIFTVFDGFAINEELTKALFAIILWKADYKDIRDRFKNAYEQVESNRILDAKKAEELERIRREEEERKAREKQQKMQWQSAGCCSFCGGAFKGKIFKKCSICGKFKDY